MFSAKAHIASSIALKEELLASPSLIGEIEELGIEAALTLESGGRIFLAGNGGSFADAQHIAAEFVSKLMSDRNPLPAIALGTNSSSMSAIGNDYGYEFVFEREIRALGTHQDLFIPISTSGNSPNILHAIEVASAKGIKTWGLTGLTGGKMNSVCKCIKVPSPSTALVQESHIMIGHIVCAIAERAFV